MNTHLIQRDPLSLLEAFEEDDAAFHQYLIITLKQEYYALPVLKVREIIEFRSVTAVPLMPDFIRGILNLRGQVVPVIDLAVRFGKTPIEVAYRTSVVIVEFYEPASDKHLTLGMMVDAVNEVLDIGPGNVEAAPAFGSGLRQDFIAGVAKHNDQFLIVLAVEHVLSVAEMSELVKSSLTEQTIS